ncbi:MAG: EF-Tu/IF-2/RF-3 family GTPase [Candidatus Thermoplasmatota archaeon]|nr:EF-Tu/IF-2/RF-3 family GTPase [Candidatus Thermoplasmatota archaeon]
MPVLNVAFVGSEKLARKLAKSNDVRDIESYVYKELRQGETCVLSLLRPLRHPEKLRHLLSVLNVAEVGIVEITNVDAALGEILVSFGAAGIDRGIAIINPTEDQWVDSEQVNMILAQAGLETWKLYESVPDLHDLREELYQHMDVVGSKNTSSNLVLPVDQHFNVKGVGLVAIGYVQSGAVNKHDEVVILPANETGVVRSLQVMDDDVDAAIAGDRVGVALRNLREEALHRGCMIIHPESEALIRHENSQIKIKTAPFQKRKLSNEDVIHAAVDLQFVVGRIKQVEGDMISVEWENPLWIRAEGSPQILITQLDAMPMRIIGSVETIVES